jgi:poly(A) polymerase
MRITDPWLTQPATQSLFEIFEGAGHQLFCVGGCVRNALLGVAVADIDMSTDARPEAVLALAKAQGLRAIPTGMDHGTVTVLSGGIPFEITTFRHDTSTDGRHATVAFSDSAKEDAQRRDFTMNALYCDAQGQVIDHVGGRADLDTRRVRFIGDPDQRITEDYLRILRFFRFHAWYGDPDQGIDAEGLAACAAHGDGLELLSRERIGAEMTKLLSAPDPAPAVAAMGQSGLLHRVMPGADAGLLAVLVHMEGTTSPDWKRRALALGGEDVAELWRLQKSDARALTQARAALAKNTALPELAYRYGLDMAQNVALVRAAMTHEPPSAELQMSLIKASQARFPVKAADLMPGLEGAALGEKLKQLEDRWIASGFTTSKDALLAE